MAVKPTKRAADGDERRAVNGEGCEGRGTHRSAVVSNLRQAVKCGCRSIQGEAGRDHVAVWTGRTGASDDQRVRRFLSFYLTLPEACSTPTCYRRSTQRAARSMARPLSSCPSLLRCVASAQCHQNARPGTRLKALARGRLQPSSAQSSRLRSILHRNAGRLRPPPGPRRQPSRPAGLHAHQA